MAANWSLRLVAARKVSVVGVGERSDPEALIGLLGAVCGLGCVSRCGFQVGVAEVDEGERGVATPCSTASTFEPSSGELFSGGEITARPGTGGGDGEHRCGFGMGVGFVIVGELLGPIPYFGEVAPGGGVAEGHGHAHGVVEALVAANEPPGGTQIADLAAQHPVGDSFVVGVDRLLEPGCEVYRPMQEAFGSGVVLAGGGEAVMGE